MTCPLRGGNMLQDYQEHKCCPSLNHRRWQKTWTTSTWEIAKFVAFRILEREMKKSLTRVMAQYKFVGKARSKNTTKDLKVDLNIDRKITRRCSLNENKRRCEGFPCKWLVKWPWLQYGTMKDNKLIPPHSTDFLRHWVHTGPWTMTTLTFAFCNSLAWHACSPHPTQNQRQCFDVTQDVTLLMQRMEMRQSQYDLWEQSCKEQIIWRRQNELA